MDKKEILRPNEDDQKRAFENDSSEYSQMNIGHTHVYLLTQTHLYDSIKFFEIAFRIECTFAGR